MPSVPPVCLMVSERQGVTGRKDDHSFDSTKLDKRSTRRDDPAAARTSVSVKQATKCSVTETRCSTGTTQKDQLLLIGLPPPVLRADPKKKVHAVDLMQIPCSQVNTYSASSPAASPSPNGLMPCVLGISHKEPSTLLDVVAGRVITFIDGDQP